MQFRFIITLFILFSSLLNAQETGLVLKMAHKEAYPTQALPLQVLFPRSFENKSRNPISVQVYVPYNKKDQGILALGVFVDDQAPFIVRRKVSPSITNKALVSFFLPNTCERGQHLIRLFIVDERGLIVDKKAPLYSRSFYFLDRDKASKIEFDADQPTLSLLSPYAYESYPQEEPLLIDIHFSDKKHLVKTPQIALSVDNQFVGFVSADRVYQLEGLEKGEHYLTLVMYEGKRKCLQNTLNSCSRKITIY